MKLIHLSDLHLGKRVNEISMLEDQQYILTQVIRCVDEVKPDALIIAGDIYDKSIPPAEAVLLFDDFLCRLAKRSLPVLIISGNHDSPERLSFGQRLMEGAGIHISPVYKGRIEPVVLRDGHGEVFFWLLPFIKPAHVRRFFPDREIENYTDACQAAVEEMHIDKSRRNVLVCHQFVTGAGRCDSEELSVGGMDNVDAAVFEDFDYVALGHIHGPQNIGSSRMRYCGTPLKYSFSEKDHFKSISLVELGEKGRLRLETLPLYPRHDMRELRGRFAELMDKDFDSGSKEDYLHIVLTDEEDVTEAPGRLRGIYPNIMHLSYDNTRTARENIIEGARDIHTKSPLELFEELYLLQNNQPMSERQRSYAAALIESIREDDK